MVGHSDDIGCVKRVGVRREVVEVVVVGHVAPEEDWSMP